MLFNRQQNLRGYCITVLSLLIISGCCRDPNAPVLDLNGPAYITVVKGETYVEQGATALDIEDGDISESIVISGSVNSNAIGTYTISYSAEDDCGNMSLKDRVVDVSFAASTLVDTLNTEYYTTNACGLSSDTSYYSLSNKNLFELLIFNFDPLHFTEQVRLDIVGDTITIPYQTNTAGDTAITGTGVFITDTSIDFTYSIIDIGTDTTSCTSTAVKM